MKKDLYPLIGLLALTLSSCHQWQVGEVIKGGQSYVIALDKDQILQYTVYTKQDDIYLAKIPEIRYTYAPRLVYFNFGKNSKFTTTHKIIKEEATGKEQWIQLKRDRKGEEYREDETKIFSISTLDSAPDLTGATKLNALSVLPENKIRLRGGPNHNAMLFNNEYSPYTINTKSKNPPSLGQYVAAAPFDYLLDPLLSITTTPIIYAIALPCIAVAAPLSFLSEGQQQHTSPKPVAAPKVEDYPAKAN